MRSISAYMPVLRSWAAYAALPAAGILTAPILARALGPEGRGQLAGMLQPLVLASAVAALGIPSAVAYFVARGSSPAITERKAGIVAVITTMVVAVVLWRYATLVARDLSLPIVGVLAVWSAFLPSAFVSIRRGRAQGQRRYSLIDLERVLGACFRGGAILLLWITGVSDVLVYAAAYMAVGLTSSLVLLNVNEDYGGADDPTAYAIGKYAAFASFGTIAAAFSARLDQALLPTIVSPASLGLYSVAVAVAEIPSIISTVAARNALTEAAKDRGRSPFSPTLIFAATVHIGLSASLAIAAPMLVPLVFGGSFASGVKLVQILLLASAANFWVTVGAAVLAGKGRPGLSSLGAASGAVVTASLFMCWAGRMDVERAAWIAVYSQLSGLTATLVAGVAFYRSREV